MKKQKLRERYFLGSITHTTFAALKKSFAANFVFLGVKALDFRVSLFSG